jgi:hypothetical protein
MSTVARERLPNRRASETFDIEVSGRKYRCAVSPYADGRIAALSENWSDVREFLASF